MSDKYQVQGDNIRTYPSNQAVLTISGDNIRKYPSNQTVLTVSGNNVRKYPSNQTLLTVSGSDIKEYPSNRTIGRISRDAVTINGKGVEIKGVGKFNGTICAAIALALLDPML